MRYEITGKVFDSDYERWDILPDNEYEAMYLIPVLKSLDGKRVKVIIEVIE